MDYCCWQAAQSAQMKIKNGKYVCPKCGKFYDPIYLKFLEDQQRGGR